MTEPPKDVVGLGNAIVDVLVEADDATLEEYGLVKGAMTLIDARRAEQLYARMQGGMECSGGSAANTMVGLVSLGGRGAYVGKVRDDALGRVFRDDLRAAGVSYEFEPAADGPPTGRCLIFVTPDAERTMNTYLGISAELAPSDVDARLIASARILYLEGYLFDPPPAKQAFLEAAEAAHAAGSRVALSLSDRFCVERHREAFRGLVGHHVDVLLANESELLALYESTSLEEALLCVGGRCEIAAVTRGARGAVVLTGGEVAEVAAEAVDRVVDTTGAGDLFASGFLFGLTHGRDPVTSARIGGIAAAEVIGHYGARPETGLEELVAERIGR